jgi:hypothetical protein
VFACNLLVLHRLPQGKVAARNQQWRNSGERMALWVVIQYSGISNEVTNSSYLSDGFVLNDAGFMKRFQFWLSAFTGLNRVFLAGLVPGDVAAPGNMWGGYLKCDLRSLPQRMESDCGAIVPRILKPRCQILLKTRRRGWLTC